MIFKLEGNKTGAAEAQTVLLTELTICTAQVMFQMKGTSSPVRGEEHGELHHDEVLQDDKVTHQGTSVPSKAPCLVKHYRWNCHKSTRWLLSWHQVTEQCTAWKVKAGNSWVLWAQAACMHYTQNTRESFYKWDSQKAHPLHYTAWHKLLCPSGQTKWLLQLCPNTWSCQKQQTKRKFYAYD